VVTPSVAAPGDTTLVTPLFSGGREKKRKEGEGRGRKRERYTLVTNSEFHNKRREDTEKRCQCQLIPPFKTVHRARSH